MYVPMYVYTNITYIQVSTYVYAYTDNPVAGFGLHVEGVVIYSILKRGGLLNRDLMPCICYVCVSACVGASL